MPQLVVLALVGAGLYAGYRWFARTTKEVTAEIRRAEDELRRRASGAALRRTWARWNTIRPAASTGPSGTDYRTAPAQYARLSLGNIGKCLTLSVASLSPCCSAVAAMMASGMSMPWLLWKCRMNDPARSADFLADRQAGKLLTHGDDVSLITLAADAGVEFQDRNDRNRGALVQRVEPSHRNGAPA